MQAGGGKKGKNRILDQYKLFKGIGNQIVKNSIKIIDILNGIDKQIIQKTQAE
jgi:hypothetical protein